MQGFKKSLVALLAVAMVFSLVGTAFAAVPADVEGTQYEDAAIRLIALGVFKGDDKGNFNPEDAITRAEAVAIIIRALGLEKSADLMKGVTKFADVNADAGLQWATGAINIAVSSGIVNGYPDGNFGGRDNVTYAQLAKMILYALNYGVTVEGGVWPTAVLAKADDLGVLDGLTVVADAPINRGFAAEMLDNSLDINSLKQTGYGDLKQFEETGDTLLEKMGLDEVEGRVVEIAEVNNRLDDDEVVIEVTKENGEDLKDAKKETYTELEGVDVQGLFGLKVRAWIKDDDVVFVENKTADNDVYTDTIDGEVEDDKVDLVVLDDDVTFDEDATIYINFEKAKLSELKDGYYGRFVEDKNKIVFASVFEFEEPYGVVVTKVDGEKIKFFNKSDKEQTLDLTDADAINVYNKDLTKTTLDAIEEATVLYYWEDSDEYHIVIVNEKAEGEVSKITNTKVTIDGTAYNFKTEGTYSLDEDDSVEPYTEKAATIKDFDEERVVALLNLKGHIRHLRAESGKTSGTLYGVVVGAPYDDEVRIFNQDGDEAKYVIEDRSDYGKFDGFKFYRDCDDTEESLKYAVTAYELTRDGEVAESDKKDKVGLAYAVNVGYNKGKPDIDPSERANQYAGKLTKKDDEEYVEVATTNGTKGFFVDKDTVLIRTLDGKELDPEIIKWDDFKDLEIKATDNSYAVVFGKDGKSADAIFFVEHDFKGWGADVYFGVVLDKPYYSSGDWKVDLDVFEEGKESYVCKNEPSFGEGDIVAFKLDAKGQLQVASPESKDDYGIDEGTVDDKYIGNSKIHSDAVIYQLDDGDIDRTLAIGDIEDKVVSYAFDGRVIKVVTYDKEKKVVTPPVEGEGTVTYIINNYLDTFNTPRLVLEDISEDEVTKNIADFASVSFGDGDATEEVSEEAMVAWLTAKHTANNLVGKYVDVTEDNELVVTVTDAVVEAAVANELIGLALVSDDAELQAALVNTNIDTIVLATGETFAGFTVEKPVTITGDAVVNGKLTVSSPGVVVDGLTINSDTHPAVAIIGSASDVKLLNNKINAVGNAGIGLNRGTGGIIEGNTITARKGITAQTSKELVIKNNEIVSTQDAIEIFLDDKVAEHNSHDNYVVEGNTDSNGVEVTATEK